MSDGAACPINLDRRGVRQRLLGGIVVGAAGLGLAAYSIAQGRGLPWRLAALALLAFAALALLQARAKT